MCNGTCLPQSQTIPNKDFPGERLRWVGLEVLFQHLSTLPLSSGLRLFVVIGPGALFHRRGPILSHSGQRSKQKASKVLHTGPEVLQLVMDVGVLGFSGWDPCPAKTQEKIPLSSFCCSMTSALLPRDPPKWPGIHFGRTCAERRWQDWEMNMVPICYFHAAGTARDGFCFGC